MSSEIGAGPDHHKHLRQLGLEPGLEVGLAEVKEAFRRSALAWHPDRHTGDSKAQAEHHFKQAHVAYQALKLWLSSR